MHPGSGGIDNGFTFYVFLDSTVRSTSAQSDPKSFTTSVWELASKGNLVRVVMLSGMLSFGHRQQCKQKLGKSPHELTSLPMLSLAPAVGQQ